MNDRFLYIFLDEAGNLDFSKNGTKYFVLGGITKERPFHAYKELTELKYDLVERGMNLEYFHAAEDNQATRNQVFDIIEKNLTDVAMDAIIVEKPKVAAVADYFKAHSLDALEIEGHCDERGTEEYNRALGEHRALALREELIRLGIDASRIETVSFGEDRPAEPGHDESAYRKNRRGEFVLEKHQNLAGLNSP